MKQVRIGFVAPILAAAILVVGFIQNVSAQKAGKATAKTSPPASSKDDYREIGWDELVPKDWDPLKMFRDTKLNSMSDRDPRALAMLQQMQEAWDNAPTNKELEGASVKLAGYLVPLEATAGAMKEFLLVPYFGACIHTPPPPANQIIHVMLTQPQFVSSTRTIAGLRTMAAISVRGTLKSSRDDTIAGVSGYQMDAVAVERYVPPGVSSLSR